jgi:cytoskeletal protein RodZ
VSIGDTLAEARRQAGLTIFQVSQQTRIRESIVRAIEQGDFSPCGGDFYARGHIRSIAEVVGVDPVPLIREYDDEHGTPGGMRAAQIFEPATPIKIREPGSGRAGKAVGVLLLAAIGFGVYHFVSQHTGHPSATPAATVRPVATKTAAPKPTATPAARRAAPAYPKGTAVVKVTANSDCWVGFYSPSGKSAGKPLVVKAGQTKTFSEKSPVSIVVGNPKGISLTVNGKAEPLNTVQVVTLHINPSDSAKPASIG